MGCGGGQARAPHACLHALRAPGCCRTRPSRSPIHPTNLQPPQRSLPTINTTPLRLPQLAYVTPILAGSSIIDQQSVAVPDGVGIRLERHICTRIQCSQGKWIPLVTVGKGDRISIERWGNINGGPVCAVI